MSGYEHATKCQIQTFYFTYKTYDYPRDSIVITYNNFRNPAAGLRGRVYEGAPNFVFHYDKRNRLKEFIGLYDTSNIETVEAWHNYSYDEDDRIVKDSLYYFPEIVNGKRASDRNVIIISYEYDIKNRISKVTTLFFGTTKIQTYTYNEKGNLIGMAYDDKINFHRTNKIWMFLSRDYSMNNPANATYSYNNYNLPTQIVCNPGGFGQFFDFGDADISFDVAEIKYSCKK